MFVDELELFVSGGRGGNGVVSFRREKYVPKGGPDGGDGGDGGSVYLWADPSKQSFLDLRYKKSLKAADGGHGRGKDRHGAAGADLFVPVPLGTVVRDSNKNIIADLTIPNQKVLVAAGGKGGKGNARFATSRRRVPRIAEKGLPGEENKIFIELKLMAQVGLVGFPNAGKSTLLSRITEARPKIASYPFTTLTPNLGVVKVDDSSSFVVADLPGLIEGAHEGAGLGHRFLRHVERNLLLLFLIDLSCDAYPPPAQAYKLLQDELKSFSPDLAGYPRVVVGNKIDLTGAEEQLKDLQEIVRQDHGDETAIFAISAVTGEGLGELLRFLFKRVTALAEEKAASDIGTDTVFMAAKTEHLPIHVNKQGDVFTVTGTEVEKMAAKTDFESEDALLRFQNYCRRSGLDQHLKKMGIKEGDTVRIGKEEFYYYE
ncbi:MAG: GTPase ObgE [Bacillota bacterium]